MVTVTEVQLEQLDSIGMSVGYLDPDQLSPVIMPLSSIKYHLDIVQFKKS